MGNSEYHWMARLVIFILKMAWGHKRATFLFFCFIAIWQLMGRMFGTGLLAPLSLAVGVAAMYAAMVTGFRVNQITGTGMPAPSLPEFVRYFSAQKSQTTELKEKWERACAAQGIKWDGQVPKLLNPRFVAFGDVRARIDPGSIYGDVRTVQNKTLQLAGSLRTQKSGGCHELVITETDPGQASVHMYFRKPLDQIRTVQQLPMPAADDEIAFAINREGTAASIKMMNTLIIGETGSGKSGTFWAIIADLVRRKVPTELWVCDPKGGMEFGILRRQLAGQLAVDANGDAVPVSDRSMVVRNFASTPAGCMELIKNFEAAMKVRQEENDRLQRRLIPKPTKEEPLAILVIDEFLSLPEITKAGSSGPLARIATQSRATLMMAVGLAQGGKISMMGDIRDLFPQSIALKTKNRHVTEAVLGGTENELSAFCSSIPADRPGTGWYRDRKGAVVKFRAPYVTDADTELLAKSEAPKGMIMRRGQTIDEVAVYRAWVGKTLAYIGKSNDPERRRKEHLREDYTEGACPFCAADHCYWWRHVDRFEVEEPWFANDVIAKAAEEVRIKREKPLMNKIHNGDNSWHRSVAAVAHRRTARVGKPKRGWFAKPEPTKPQDEAVKPVQPVRPVKGAEPKPKRAPKARMPIGPIPVPEREPQPRPARRRAKKTAPAAEAKETPSVVARPLVESTQHHGGE